MHYTLYLRPGGKLHCHCTANVVYTLRRDYPYAGDTIRMYVTPEKKCGRSEVIQNSIEMTSSEAKDLIANLQRCVDAVA